jgi:dolichol-phosphate mannosyltransferase
VTGISPVLIVIPTYDGADNIVAALDRVRRAAPRADVLVVDDLGPDGAAVHQQVGRRKQVLGAHVAA